MADAEELMSGLGLVVSGLGLGLTIFFWPRPHSSLVSLTSLQKSDTPFNYVDIMSQGNRYL